MKIIILATMLMFQMLTLSAQNTPRPCSAQEATQFDFWVGNWNLYSADTLTGTNTVYKVMEGCAVQENFSSPDASYIGKSWSVYSPLTKLWQQTWVDNQGGFIYLTGKFEYGALTLFTQPGKLPNGKEVTNRMVFHSINLDSFDWEWEASTDNGTTWKNNWHIHYMRKK